MAITLSDVATAAGVSVSTASRALSGRGELDPGTRAMVAECARELGYRRLDRRGRPREGTARLMDLVLGHFHDSWADEVVAGARSMASALGYDLVLMTERDSPEDDWPRRIRRRGSAGAVLGLIAPTRSQRAVLDAAGIPIVLLDPRAEASADLSAVRTTDRQGGFDAGEHLIACGAHAFIVVSGLPSYRFGRARTEGFDAALAARGRTARHVAAQWTAAGARAELAPLLAVRAPQDRIGVFACSDEMAVGVYAAVADAGLRIPDDVLVIGFDDIREARLLSPPLTTVRQPIREMAAAAVRSIDDAVSRGLIGPSSVELPTTLIVRGSAPAPDDPGG